MKTCGGEQVVDLPGVGGHLDHHGVVGGDRLFDPALEVRPLDPARAIDGLLLGIDRDGHHEILVDIQPKETCGLLHERTSFQHQRTNEKREAGNLHFSGHGFTHSSELYPEGGVSSERNRAGPSHTISELDRIDIGPSHTHSRRARTPQSLATGWLVWDCLQPRRVPAQFTEGKYNRLIRQPASSRPEERPGVPGSSLLLAHTSNNNPVNSTDPTGNRPLGECGYQGEDCPNGPDSGNSGNNEVGSPTVSPNSPSSMNMGGAQHVSDQGKTFIENAESLNGINNQALYNDINGNCTIGFGSLIANNNCGWAETTGHRFYTQDGTYYVLDRWENQPFALANVSMHPVKNPIWALSDDEAERMMDIELDHQAAMIASGLTVTLSQNQWDAVQSFVYQNGKVSKIVGILNTGDFSLAAKFIRNYGKDPTTGLYPFPAFGYRRNQEADLFSLGYYDYFK